MGCSKSRQKGSDMHYAGLRKYDNRRANSETGWLRPSKSDCTTKILHKANEKQKASDSLTLTYETRIT